MRPRGHRLLRRPVATLHATLSALLPKEGTTTPCPDHPPRQTHRLTTQNHRTHRPSGGPETPAPATVRGRRPVGRSSRSHELHRHVAEELDDEDGVFILDPSTFVKKGEASCGVARQWCGRLGKTRQLSGGRLRGLRGPARLRPGRGQPVPAPGLGGGSPASSGDLRAGGRDLSGEVADRPGPARPGAAGVARAMGGGRRRVWPLYGDCGACCGCGSSRYVLDVPCNTLVRDLSERRPPSASARTTAPAPVRAGGSLGGPSAKRALADGHSAGRGERAAGREGVVGDGANQGGGRLRRGAGASGRDPRVADKPQTWYTLSNDKEAARVVLARVHGNRHRIEELLEQGKQEVGL